MGFVDKFKDLFTDVVEEESEPIKKEVMHVEISNPKEDVKKEEEKTEEPLPLEKDLLKDIKKEEKVWFDDDDFDTLPKPEKKEPPKKIGSSYRIEKKEVKKHFSPSPIISPVYGVLDKNYIKEDVRERNKKDMYSNTNTDLSIDAIRKKAFGTLEDELEMDLYRDTESKKIESTDLDDMMYEDEPPSNDDIFDELDFNLDGVVDDEKALNEDYRSSRSERNKPLFDELIDDSEEEKEKDDLFDLIDNMYDEKEGE